MGYLLWGLSDGSEIELSGDSRDPAVRSQVTSELIRPGVHGVLRTHVGPCGSKTSRSRKQFIEASVLLGKIRKNKGKIENIRIP